MKYIANKTYRSSSQLIYILSKVTSIHGFVVTSSLIISTASEKQMYLKEFIISYTVIHAFEDANCMISTRQMLYKIKDS